MKTKPPWWPTKAQKDRADKAHAEAIQRKADDVCNCTTCQMGYPCAAAHRRFMEGR